MPYVYPVPGRYLSGVPHVPHDCADESHVASGAFTTEPPIEAEQPTDVVDAASPESKED